MRQGQSLAPGSAHIYERPRPVLTASCDGAVTLRLLDGNGAPQKGNGGMKSGDQQQCAAADERCILDGVPSSQPRDQVREIFPRLVVFC